MAPTDHDPAERGYLRLFYRDWHPDPPGETRDRGLGLGVGPWLNAASPPYAAGERATQRPAPRYCPRSRQARRAAVPGVDARQRFGWVRNIRAAGGKAFVKRDQSRPVQLTEVPAGERGPILKAYCQVATSGCRHYPVSHNAPLSEFDAVAERYPVFRIDPA